VSECLTCIPGIWGDIACEKCERRKAVLTELELKWLKDRHKSCARCVWDDGLPHGCLMCNYDSQWFESECDPDSEYCAYWPDYKDAAEFEAIVQKYLLKEPGQTEPPCWYGQHKPEPLCVVECDSPWLTCKEQRLKWARLKAEEEMDAHN